MVSHIKIKHCYFSVSQQPNSGLNRHIFPVSRLRTIRRTKQVGLLCTKDKLILEAATAITHNRHNIKLSISSKGFEPGIPEIERPQINTLDRAVTGVKN